MILVFAAAYGASLLLNDSAQRSCLCAIIVNAIGAFGGVIPVVYAAILKPTLSAYHVFATSVIRLLLVITGSVIILLCVKISVFWFAIWTITLYVAVLVAEAFFVAGIMQGCGDTNKQDAHGIK